MALLHFSDLTRISTRFSTCKSYLSLKGAMLGGMLFALSTAASAVTILGASERAQPGETISINGNGFDSTSQVWARTINDTGDPGAPVRWTVSGQASTCLHAQVPTNMAGRLWQIWVQTNSGGSSTPVYVNKVRPYMMDSTEAAPNGLVRIFGRNMKAPGTTSQNPGVRFLTSTMPLNATVVAATPYCLTFRVPSTAKVGMNYTILVRNGAGGLDGQAFVPQKLMILAPQTDYLGLGINWASAIRFAANVYNVKTDPRLTLHATANGVANDSPAIRAAILKAKQDGGGVVYLPAGTYQADDGSQIGIPSNVILKGDGPGQTILHFGYRFTPLNPAGGEWWWMAFDVGDLSGVMNMTCQNQNTGPVPNQTVGRKWYTAPHAHRFFFSNVDFQLGNGCMIYLDNTSKGVMQDCVVTSTNVSSGQQAAPIHLSNLDQWIVRRSTFNFRVARVYFTASTRSVFESNTINRDNTYTGPFESGGLETSYSQTIVVQNNIIRGTGPANYSHVDGELLMTQKSSIADLDDVGHVTSAASGSISNTSRIWPSGLVQQGVTDLPRSVIKIIGGTGVGQWRFVTSHTSSTVFINSPWTVVPDSTSTYSLGSLCNYQQLVLGNSLSNSSFGGIVWWDGAVDSVCDGNTLTNTGRLLLRCPDGIYTGSAGSNRRHDVGWNVMISNNTVINTNGLLMAQIEVGALNIGQTSYGNLIMGVEVRDNSVLSTVPTQYEDEQGNSEGIWNTVIFEGFSASSSPTDNIGTIYQGNNYSGAGVGFHDYGTALTSVLGAVGTGP